MNYTIPILLIGLFNGCIGSKPIPNAKSDSLVNTYTVSGSVLQQFPYCQGARPTQEMLTIVTTPVAYPNKTFYVRKGNTNTKNGEIVNHFTTNSEGFFSLSLLPGIYSIIVEEQLNAINPKKYITETQKVNESCLIDWWGKPYYLLEVKDQNINSLNFTFMHRCFLNTDIPCVDYKGPLLH